MLERAKCNKPANVCQAENCQFVIQFFPLQVAWKIHCIVCKCFSNASAAIVRICEIRIFVCVCVCSRLSEGLRDVISLESFAIHSVWEDALSAVAFVQHIGHSCVSQHTFRLLIGQSVCDVPVFIRILRNQVTQFRSANLHYDTQHTKTHSKHKYACSEVGACKKCTTRKRILP